MSYYISPRFLDKLAVHLAKNFMKLPNVNVPLILGIHGGKGEGKSFQCELAFEKGLALNQLECRAVSWKVLMQAILRD